MTEVTFGEESCGIDREHTGVCASWCPMCGDCTCPRNEDGEPIFLYAAPQTDPVHVIYMWSPPIVDTVANSNCPLHGEASRHCEDT